MSVSIPITTDLGGVITYPEHHHYCGPLSKALNAPQCTAPWLPKHVDPCCFFMLQICFFFPSEAEIVGDCWNPATEIESTGQRCAISSGAINHRYAHEKSHLFKHDSIRSQSRVSFSSSGKYHHSRIKNEKFKNYFWSFPTRLENLKPNLREDFHNLKNKTKKTLPKCKLSKHSHGSRVNKKTCVEIKVLSLFQVKCICLCCKS